MSWLSSAIGKIPVIGHPLNQVGKVLPSGGQIIGSAALGPIGTVIGGSVDGNTTPLQKNVGNTIAGLEGAAGIGSLAAGAGAAGAAGAGGAGTAAGTAAGAAAPSALSGLLDYIKAGGKDILGFLQNGGLGKVADAGLGALALKQAGDLQGQSTKYAQDALKTATDSYGSDTAQTGRAPLRLAGVANMLDPSKIATSTAGIGAVQGIGNPFAPKPPMPLGVPPRPGSPAGGPVPITPPLTRPPLAGQSYA